jgi:DNA-binding NarL/FixJ family response regulator
MAVALVVRGHFVLRSSLAPELVRAVRQSASLTDVQGLTTREREVLHDLAMGSTNSEIAARRHISIGTVKVHLRALKDKTGEPSRAGLIALAHRSRVLT